MSEPLRDQGIDDLETALKALRPASVLDRDRLMYRAGQMSALRQSAIWGAAAVIAGAAAAVLAVVLVARPGPAVVERIVTVTVREPAVTPPRAVADAAPVKRWQQDVELENSSFSAGNSNLTVWHLEKQALRWGVESLPSPPSSDASAAEPPTLGSLMDQLAKGRLLDGLER